MRLKILPRNPRKWSHSGTTSGKMVSVKGTSLRENGDLPMKTQLGLIGIGLAGLMTLLLVVLPLLIQASTALRGLGVAS